MAGMRIKQRIDTFQNQVNIYQYCHGDRAYRYGFSEEGSKPKIWSCYENFK